MGTPDVLKSCWKRSRGSNFFPEIIEKVGVMGHKQKFSQQCHSWGQKEKQTNKRYTGISINKTITRKSHKNFYTSQCGFATTGIQWVEWGMTFY